MNGKRMRSNKKKPRVPFITPREREVLQTLSQGFSTQQVADQLGITFNTVETHRKALLKKFAAKNTVQMMVMAKEILNEK